MLVLGGGSSHFPQRFADLSHQFYNKELLVKAYGTKKWSVPKALTKSPTEKPKAGVISGRGHLPAYGKERGTTEDHGKTVLRK